jgi:hypothetical protein
MCVRHTTMFVENFKIFDLTHRGLLPLDTGAKSKSLPVLRPPAYKRVVPLFSPEMIFLVLSEK